RLQIPSPAPMRPTALRLINVEKLGHLFTGEHARQDLVIHVCRFLIMQNVERGIPLEPMEKLLDTSDIAFQVPIALEGPAIYVTWNAAHQQGLNPFLVEDHLDILPGQVSMQERKTARFAAQRGFPHKPHPPAVFLTR